MEAIAILSPEEKQALFAKLDRLEETLSKITPHKFERTLYTPKEAASILKVSQKTLQTYRDKGFITYSQIGSKILFAHSDLEAFLDRFKVKRQAS